MAIENYIKELLFEQSCVVIPDFGGFIAEHRTVEIHPITNRFLPPTKRIAFNEQLSTNDGLLANTISREESITMVEATAKIKSFVAELRASLSLKNSFVFQDIGKLFYNDEQKLEFVPDTSINYLEDSFGLQELFFKPIERTNIDMTTPQRPVRPVVRKPIPNEFKNTNEANANSSKETGKSSFKMILVVLPLLLLVIVGGLIVYSKNNNKNLASLLPFITSPAIDEPSMAQVTEEVILDSTSLESINDNETIDEEVSTEDEEISTEIGGKSIFKKEENPAKQNLIDKQKELSDETYNEGVGSSTSHQGRFFVIVGSFMSRDNAYKMRNKVSKLGANVTVIEPSPSSKFYKVALDDFDNQEDADKKKKDLMQDFGSTVWVMSF